MAMRERIGDTEGAVYVVFTVGRDLARGIEMMFKDYTMLERTMHRVDGTAGTHLRLDETRRVGSRGYDQVFCCSRAFTAGVPRL
jgi:hypothetical protein